MAARGIPRNPNLPPTTTPHGLDSHWRRTLVLVGLLVLVGYFLYARSAPIRVFTPLPRRVRATPALATPALAVRSQARPIVAAGVAVPTVTAHVAPEEQVRGALRLFNDAFRAARASADPAGLARVATGAWLELERARVGGLHAQGVAEEWALVQLDIQRVVVDGATATACTAERWSHVRLQGGTNRGPADQQRFIERYTLARQGDHWLVSQIVYLDGPCEL